VARVADGGAPVRLAPHDPLALSPDARWVAVRERSRDGVPSIWLYPTGAGEPRKLLDLPPMLRRWNWRGDFTADGKRLFLHARGREAQFISIGAPALQAVAVPKDLSCRSVARDGQTLICTSHETSPSSASGVVTYVYFSPATGERTPIESPPGMRLIRELSDGSLAFLDERSEPSLWRVPRGGQPELLARLPRPFHEWADVAVLPSRDASAWVYGYQRFEYALHLVDGIR
jgi:hypothetical protein